MMIRRLFLLLLCMLSLQSCTSDSPALDYTIIHYPSTQSILEMFDQHKAAFEQMSQLLYDKGDFFDEIDGGFMYHIYVDYSPYFTQEEWQSVKEFMAETGLYSIEWHPVSVNQYSENKRIGILLKYTFCMDEKTTCMLACLSTPDDADIEAHMRYLHYEQRTKYLNMEMEELEDGWYFFIHHHDH